MAISDIEQHAFGDVSNLKFGGTNVILEGNRIILIKGDDSPAAWTDTTSATDASRVLYTSSGDRGSSKRND